MLKYLTPILLLWFVVSCKTKDAKVLPPKSVIDKEHMVEVLCDIHLVEAGAYMKRLNDTARFERNRKEYAKVMKLHEIDFELFTKSWKWYINNPAVLNFMYEDVISCIKEAEKLAPENLEKLKDSVDRTQKYKNKELETMEGQNAPMKEGDTQ